MPTKSLDYYWNAKKPRQFYPIPGMDRLNELLGGGFVKQASHLLFAETGRGKTSLAIDMTVRWLTLTDIKVCFISLEEDVDEVQSRLAARLLNKGISYRDILAGELDDKSKSDVSTIFAGWTGRLKLENVTTADVQNISDIESVKKIIELNMYDYDIFIIDHIHHIQMEGKDNQTTITGLLADHIKTLNNQGATIIALAQMRKSENIKQIEDFGQRTYESIAGSSKNMQNASTITHLYVTQKQKDWNMNIAERGIWNEHLAVIRVEKSRYGRKGGALIQFNPTNCYFEEEKHDTARYIEFHESVKNK